jgi:tRNA threonylcarbamoyladenosine biosynthesis protein TsaE
MQSYTTTSEEETVSLAEKLAGGLTPGAVLALRGGLGAGKTAFVRGLALGLGLADDVSSPTFALVHEYRQGKTPLFHFDMYRVSGYGSLCSTGFYDYLDTRGVLAIEWSENIQAYLPKSTITVTIDRIDDTLRRILLEEGTP